MAQVAEEVSEQTQLLQGFVALVAERYGYWAGRRAKQVEMNEATKEEREKATKLREGIREDIEVYLKTPKKDIAKKIVGDREALAETMNVVNAKAKPFRQAMSPLGKAIRYLDVVAIPDALKELDHPVKPIFSLSGWVIERLEAQKKKAK